MVVVELDGVMILEHLKEVDLVVEEEVRLILDLHLMLQLPVLII
jgi:hypothetical protein